MGLLRRRPSRSRPAATSADRVVDRAGDMVAGADTDRPTEVLLTYLGPAQVGHPAAAGRPANDDERARDAALRTEFVRVTGADGRTFLVERPVVDEP
ncbi:hypothetical protein [Cellulomonas marina]|uniref:Uncharacterized protein n=1 Tax=Cellulomonas marina TaxID=988821 RepID=A0A1I0ZGQ6_9CELL|nr:hypothetical protein [Cellulomonas marina]GIG28522.1 hypothetical protein Cma02nite_11220 [Cellulomonas marina]SFB24316.1 hypothetical protein SAMN05421867_1118 [Cellulomonas marina]